MAKSAHVTAAEISRLAGVTRATVSNWRRRHADFPAPSGGTDSSPAYDLEAVRTWLAARNQLPSEAADEQLRAALRALPSDWGLEQLFALVVATAELGEDELRALTELPEDQLLGQLRVLTDSRRPPEKSPNVEFINPPAGLSIVIDLLQHVRDEGAISAIDVLAEQRREASGTYETPAPLAELMADLLTKPKASYPQSVLDPACGGGNILAATARHGAKTIYGQDVVSAEAAEASARVGVVAPEATVQVDVGDSLRNDAFPDLRVDAVLCNPPYGNREWGHAELAYDPRWAYGLPPKGESELAWVQHCLAHLTPGGTAILLMPPAAAERASGRRIRAELLRAGAVQAVMALPAGAATPLHIGLHLWVLRRPVPQQPIPQSVLFVDAVDHHALKRSLPATKRPAVDWAPLHTTLMITSTNYLAASDSFETVPGVARAVAIMDLLDESVDLTPARHVRAAPLDASPDDHARSANAIRAQLREAAAALAGFGADQSWVPAGTGLRTWRSATVGDLVRGGALILLKAPQSITAGNDPSTAMTAVLGEEVTIRPGDVILPELLRADSRPARVAEMHDDGATLERNLYLLRPDPARLDPQFLAGFLAAEDNVQGATTGTSIIRIDPRRLRVPLLPLDEQQRYGQAFHQLQKIRLLAERTSELAEETAATLSSGLTGGALLPPNWMTSGSGVDE